MNELFNKSLNFTIEKKKNSFENRKINFPKMLPTDDNEWINRRNISYITFVRTRWIDESWILLNHVLFFIRPPVIRGYRIWLFPLRDYRSCGLSRLRNCIRWQYDGMTAIWKKKRILHYILELNFSKIFFSLDYLIQQLEWIYKWTY